MLDYLKAGTKRMSSIRRASSSNRGKQTAAQGAEEQISSPNEPLINPEDEDFFQKLLSHAHGDPPPLPARNPDAQSPTTIQIPDDAVNTPLPDAATTPLQIERALEGAMSPATAAAEEKKVEEKKEKEKKKKNRLSFFRRDSSAEKKKKKEERDQTADDLKAAADKLKETENEQTKEDEELERVLDQLNLAADKNRVFSVSTETRELMKKFTLVLKDIVHGAPTAYHDLESLLTNSNNELQKMYDSLPSFLKTLVEKLPDKMKDHIGPELLAAAAEKPSLAAAATTAAASSAEAGEASAAGGAAAGGLLGKAGKMAAKAGLKKVPTLKELVTTQGAVATMLRAIVNFLRQRFPAVMGLNVLWTLAISVLLLIFWYCYKRGREVRLEKERKVTEEEMAAIKAEVASSAPGEYHAASDTTAGGAVMSPAAALLRDTTTAPAGASLDEVRAGMLEVGVTEREREREAAAAVRGAGPAAYAPEGSLGKALREEEERKKREEEKAVAGAKAALEGKKEGEAKAE